MLRLPERGWSVARPDEGVWLSGGGGWQAPLQREGTRWRHVEIAMARWHLRDGLARGDKLAGDWPPWPPRGHHASVTHVHLRERKKQLGKFVRCIRSLIYKKGIS